MRMTTSCDEYKEMWKGLFLIAFEDALRRASDGGHASGPGPGMMAREAASSAMNFVVQEFPLVAPRASPTQLHWSYCNDHGPLHAFVTPDDWDRATELRSLCGKAVRPAETHTVGRLSDCEECETRTGAPGPNARFKDPGHEP